MFPLRIRPALTREQARLLDQWIIAHDQAWIRDVREARNGDWRRLNLRCELLRKRSAPSYEPSIATNDEALDAIDLSARSNAQ
jgi:hypothetical protein